MDEKPAYVQAYAVLRVDHGPVDAPARLREYTDILKAGSSHVTVKEVVMTAEEARSEVVRLNELKAGKVCTYFWQSTHVFFDGGSHGSRPGEVS